MRQVLSGRTDGDQPDLAAAAAAAGQQIALDDEAPEYFGILLSGSVKLTKVLPDGRQRIVGLLFPSDFVGSPFGAWGLSRGGGHRRQPVLVLRGPFERLAREYPGIQHQFFRFALGQLVAAQEWMLLLGRKTAREKVISLLLMIANRTARTPAVRSRHGAITRSSTLPLSRSDIADYLGFTLETVSRQFRILKSEN